MLELVRFSIDLHSRWSIIAVDKASIQIILACLQNCIAFIYFCCFIIQIELKIFELVSITVNLIKSKLKNIQISIVLQT